MLHAVAAFRSRLHRPIAFLEVLCLPDADGVDLRHVTDADRATSDLKVLDATALGAWAEITSRGAFRPNRCAPTLRSGWRCHVATDAELHEALEQLYPGALADWHAWESGIADATSFRHLAGRQGGMYRVVQNLTDRGIEAVARAGCAQDLCLRRRYWSAPGAVTSAAAPEQASLSIPCLEPCALVLDLARWMAQEQELSSVQLNLIPGELDSIVAGLEAILEHPPQDLREGSTRHPANPRRLHLLAARLRELRKCGDLHSQNKGT